MTTNTNQEVWLADMKCVFFKKNQSKTSFNYNAKVPVVCYTIIFEIFDLVRERSNGNCP